MGAGIVDGVTIGVGAGIVDGEGGATEPPHKGEGFKVQSTPELGSGAREGWVITPEVGLEVGVGVGVALFVGVGVGVTIGFGTLDETCRNLS